MSVHISTNDRILNNEDLKTTIDRIDDARIDAHVGLDTTKDQGVDSVLREIGLELRRSERGEGVFLELVAVRQKSTKWWNDFLD